jgi:cysteine desulfuration protein SufE
MTDADKPLALAQGFTLDAEALLQDLAFFDGWEDRYKYIIDLGKALPPAAESLRQDANLIRGCQSQVWMQPLRAGDLWYFAVDSDAFIVKGLLALVLAAYHGKSTQAILAFDMEAYFNQLGLLKHLSPTRGSGLRAMVARIRQWAEVARDQGAVTE